MVLVMIPLAHRLRPGAGPIGQNSYQCDGHEIAGTVSKEHVRLKKDYVTILRYTARILESDRLAFSFGLFVCLQSGGA